MNVELQIMFHVLLFAVCVVITFLRKQWSVSLARLSREHKIYDDLNTLEYTFECLRLFIPLEIVFWILYWIFV